MTQIYSGLHWKKGCFHIHTPASDDYGLQKDVPNGELERSYESNRKITPEQFLLNLITKGFQFITVTDHNSVRWIELLRNALDKIKSTQSDIEFTIFPGIELNTSEYHLELILDPHLNTKEIQEIATKLLLDDIDGKSGVTLPGQQNLSVNLVKWQNFIDLEEHLKKITINNTNIKYLLIFPHIQSNYGIHQCSRDTKERVYRSTRALFGISQNLTTPVSIARLRSEMFNLPLSYIMTSDYHGRPNETFIPTWIRFASMNLDSLRQAIYDSESRISLIEPDLIKHPYISKLICPGSYFGNIQLEFNPNINTFIGGRGAGKSAILELIFYALGKLDILWKRTNKSDKEFVKKTISKINSLIGRNSQISLEIKNICSTYPIIEIRRDITYISKSQKELLSDTEINSILHLPIEFYHANNKISSSELIETFAEMYYQDEFFTLNVNKKFPLSILELFFEQNSRLKVGDLEKEISKIENEIKSLHLKIISKYRTPLDSKSIVDQGYIDQKIVNKKKELDTLFSQMKKISSEPDQQLQNEHQLWMSINEKNNKNNEKINKLDTFLSKIIINFEIQETIDYLTPDELKLKDTQFVQENYSKIDQIIKSIYENIEGFKNTISKKQTEIIKILFDTNESFNSIYANHKTDYEKMQQKNKDSAILRDKINKTTSELKELNEELQNNRSKVDEIVQLEKELLTKLKEYYKKWSEFIGRRNASMSLLNNTLPKLQYDHLKFRFEFIWNYKEILKQFSLKIQDDQLTSICEKFSGMEFIQLLNDLRLDLKSAFVTRFELLNLTKTTQSKLKNLFPQDLELPKSCRGLLDEKLQSIEHSGLEETISIDVKKGEGDLVNLNEVSPGEQQRNLLLLSLIEKGIPLIIDQPEDHLDFIIKNSLPDLLRQYRGKRQFIIVTHFQNIPVLSDAELIIYLEEKYNSKEKRMEMKKIEGSFENMANDIIKLDGGPSAIKKRIERYSEFIKDL